MKTDEGCVNGDCLCSVLTTRRDELPGCLLSSEFMHQPNQVSFPLAHAMRAWRVVWPLLCTCGSCTVKKQTTKQKTPTKNLPPPKRSLVSILFFVSWLAETIWWTRKKQNVLLQLRRVILLYIFPSSVKEKMMLGKRKDILFFAQFSYLFLPSLRLWGPTKAENIRLCHVGQWDWESVSAKRIKWAWQSHYCSSGFSCCGHGERLRGWKTQVCL